MKPEFYGCFVTELSHSSRRVVPAVPATHYEGSRAQPGNDTQLCLIVTDTDAGSFYQFPLIAFGGYTRTRI